MYTYSVDGIEYTNDDKYFSEIRSYSTREWIPLFRYPIGKNVTIYFDPEEPEISFLKNSIPPWRITIFSFIAFLDVLGYLVLKKYF